MMLMMILMMMIMLNIYFTAEASEEQLDFVLQMVENDKDLYIR